MRIFQLFLLTFPISVIGQSLIGTIIDKKTKAGIPYATVGLVKENIGTNADENGIFILSSKNQKPDDSIIISSVGYETKKIPLKELTYKILIELNQKEKKLENITVVAKSNWNSTTLNDFSKCEDWGLSTNGFQTQIAQLFHSPANNAILVEMRVCTQHDIFSSNNTIFRIRVYDQDSLSGKPSIDLCDEPIEITTKNKYIDIDLEKFHILINKNFFIAIEWLKIPYNKQINKFKRNGRNISDTTYRPSIGMTELKNVKSETWMLTYQNYWQPMTFRNSIPSISITLKY